jgi:hypothetical protein
MGMDRVKGARIEQEQENGDGFWKDEEFELLLTNEHGCTCRTAEQSTYPKCL